MSHRSTTAITATPPVTVVSSGLSSISSVTMAPSLMGLPATLGQLEVVLLPPLMQSCPGGVIGLASVLQHLPPSLMPLLAYANYAMGLPQVGFFFRFEPPTILFIICLVSFLVSAFYFHVPSWLLYSPMGTQPLGFAPLQPFGVYLWQAYVQPYYTMLREVLYPCLKCMDQFSGFMPFWTMLFPNEFETWLAF